MEIDFTSKIRAADECSCGVCDEEDCQCPCHCEKNELPSQEELIAFSIDIVKIFENKVKAHNEAFPKNQVSVDDLKKMFMQGASSENRGGFSLVELGLAGVNAFLNLKAGNCGSYEAKFSLTLPKESLNVSAHLSPNEEDFNKAKEDITKYNLDISKAKSSEDFYIETQDQVRRRWIEY
jgi:hypothetical protein